MPVFDLKNVSDYRRPSERSNEVQFSIQESGFRIKGVCVELK